MGKLKQNNVNKVNTRYTKCAMASSLLLDSYTVTHRFSCDIVSLVTSEQ
jgi:hypothetical protein